MLNIRATSEATIGGEMDLLRLSLRTVNRRDDLDNETLDKLEKQKNVGPDSNKEDSEQFFGTRHSNDDGSEMIRTISLDEVAWHDTMDDCWLVIYDYVYDCTDFLKNHPGGEDILLEYAGRDATLAFVGTGHSKFARQALERYFIGELPPNERIFRVPGGIQIAGV